MEKGAKLGGRRRGAEEGAQPRRERAEVSGTAAGSGAARESPGNWGPRVLRVRRGFPCRAPCAGSVSAGTSTPLALHLAARSLVGTIVRSWVLGGVFGEDPDIRLGKPR